jgi:hypothetical protein
VVIARKASRRFQHQALDVIGVLRGFEAFGDQAHLVRDFTTFAGAAPERWRNRESEAPPKQIFNPTMGDHG